MPYGLADYVDGVGIFSGRISPAHFPERAHPEITVEVSYEDTSLLASWQTATGRQVSRLIRDGHVSVIPGDQPHGGEWRREADHLILYLDPGFVSGAARDLLGEDPVELVGNYTAEDPLIGGLASALRAELKTEGGPQRLYLESLANVLAAHLIRNYSAKGGLEHASVEAGGLSKSRLAAVTAINSGQADRQTRRRRLDHILTAINSPAYACRQRGRNGEARKHRATSKVTR